MSATAHTHFLTNEQVQFYKDNGYLHLKAVIPEAVLGPIQPSLQKWVNRVLSKWQAKGLIDNDFSQLPFETRLLEAWTAANYPPCNPMLTPEIFSREFFEFMRSAVFVDVARDLLDTENLKALWGFTCRPKLPPRPPVAAQNAPWIEIDVPWHQDAQYTGNTDPNFIIMWVPLVDVDEKKSPLQLAEGHQRDGLYKNHKHGGYCSIHPDEVGKLTHLKTIEMQRGDLLCMNALLPHRSLANQTRSIRWSIDMRFENTDMESKATPVGGFVCANEDASKVESSFESCYANFQAEYKKINI